MGKGKISWKWLSIIAGVTAVAIAVTLGVCFSRKEEICATGFCYDKFNLELASEGSYLFSPYGDVIALQGDVPFWAQSMDGRTAVWGWEDRTFSVVSEHGIRHIDQKVGEYLDGSDRATIFVSAYGDVVYFFDEFSFDANQMNLWRYNVAEDELVQVDTIGGAAFPCVVSPDGSAFAINEYTGTAGVNISIYHDNEKLGTWNIMEFYVAINFVTDDGVAFVSDVSTPLQSISEEGQFAYPGLEGRQPQSIYFNQDGTEILVNLVYGGCHYYQVAQGAMQSHVQLTESGLQPYLIQTMQRSYGDVSFDSDFEDDFSTTLNVASFRDINLKDTVTEQRVKLTEENILVYQEGSELMEGTLASSGTYMMYVDENGDYFYTDTEDEEGNYELLWEASDSDVDYVIHTTGRKSFYYVDEDGNFWYAKQGTESRICSSRKWSTVTNWVVEDATDTVYFIEDGTLYCCREGGELVEMMDMEDEFSGDMEYFILLPDTSAGVYCAATDGMMEEAAFCRLYADGSYQMMETE